MTTPEPIAQLDRRSDAEKYRSSHPTLRLVAPVWEATSHGGRWAWLVDMEAGPTFRSSVEIDTGVETPAPAPDAAIGQVLAVIDSLSYWKAAVPGRIIVDGTLPGTKGWWQGFVAHSMGEHLWRNGLDPSWLPDLDATFTDKPLDAPDRLDHPDATLVLHSGGKDSITAAHLVHRSARAVRPVSYQPTTAMRAVVRASVPASGWAGPPVTIHRRLDPQILDLNAAGYLNGHTPYSAWLAAAAAAAADLCGIAHVAAGNSRSDDEPNFIGSLPTGEAWPINHQWSKSAAFETAWTEISGPGRRYASPMRPLFELAVLAGLHADPLPGYTAALSCNRAAKAGRDGTWCGRCPKCLWTAAAFDAIAGPGAGADRLGVDALADTGNVELLTSMCGRAGPVPFECAGTPAEVRAVLRELRSRPQVPAAVASLADAYLEARGDDATLGQLVADIGEAPLLHPAEHDAARAWAIAGLDHLYDPAAGAAER